MTEQESAFEAISEAARKECEEIARRLYTGFRDAFPEDLLHQSVASAVSIIGHSLIGATYETLKKTKSETVAREWLEATIADIGIALGHSGLDLQFVLKSKEGP